MNKLKSLGSGIRSKAASNKLSKAFKFDGNKPVLGVKAEGEGGNTFSDGPGFEEPSLSKRNIYIHCASLFVSLLAICTIGAVAAYQAKWIKVSGGVGFTMFLLLLAFFLQVMLLTVPLIYDRWDRLKRAAQFLAQTRTVFILHGFGTVLLLLAGMTQTISTWTAPGCKDPENDPNAGLGDAYTQGLPQWCLTRRASAIFDWLAFGCWLLLFVFTTITFRRERKREPSFTPPSNEQGVSYTNFSRGEEASTYGDKMAQADETMPIHAHAASMGSYDHSQRYSYAAPTYQAPAYDEHAAYSAIGSSASGGKSSMDAYGDGNRMSRTMQMAQTAPPRAPQMPNPYDPYAQIRDSLMQPPSGGYGYAQNAGLYQTGGANPPAYGYR